MTISSYINLVKICFYALLTCISTIGCWNVLQRISLVPSCYEDYRLFSLVLCLHMKFKGCFITHLFRGRQSALALFSHESSTQSPLKRTLTSYSKTDLSWGRFIWQVLLGFERFFGANCSQNICAHNDFNLDRRGNLRFLFFIAQNYLNYPIIVKSH